MVRPATQRQRKPNNAPLLPPIEAHQRKKDPRLVAQSPFSEMLKMLFLERKKLLPQNPVGFPSRCRLFGHAEELFREVGHGDKTLEFRGDLLGNILSFSEGVAESVDIDFDENFFE